MVERLQRYWVYGGFQAGVMLLVLMPLLVNGWSLALTAVFLQLPVYMLHQFEEHDDDRFRRYVNTHIGGGLDVLPRAAVWLVNVPGVWGVNTAAILLAWAVDPGLGLIGVYLTLVNAVVHIIQGVRIRGYNPGLVTAVVLFLPVSSFGIWAVSRTPYGTLTNHLVGLVVALLIHAALIAYVTSRRASLTKAIR